jgi:hypothetical protein
VLEEPVILGGQHGVDQHEGHVGQPHRPVLLAAAVVGAGEDLGFEGGGSDVVAVATDAGDPVVVNLHAHELRGDAGATAQEDVPVTPRPAELTGCGRRAPRLGVLQARQRPRQVDTPDLEAGDERLGGGVHVRRAPRLHAREAGEGDRGVRDESEQEHGDQCGGAETHRSPARRSPVE